MLRERQDVNYGHIDNGNIIGHYLQEIGQIPPLTADEEIELAKAIELGREAEEQLQNGRVNGRQRVTLETQALDGNQAHETLVKANLRLVVSVAKYYQERGIPFLDLIQEGNIGLLTAVDKFDWRRGNRFGTYATYWIREKVERAVIDKGRTIRISSFANETLRAIIKAEGHLIQVLRREPTPEEIAAYLGEKVKKIKTIMAASKFPFSFDASKEESETNEGLEETVEDKTAEMPFEQVAQKFLKKELLELLETLPVHEAQALVRYYGINGNSARVWRLIGKGLELCRERARQIGKEGLGHLREDKRTESLRVYLRD
jgi:RNA polymerase primary sigma factor